MLDIVDCNIALDVLLCCFDQVCGRLESIHILKAYRSLPGSRFFFSFRFSLPDIFIKFTHLSSSRQIIKVKKLNAQMQD